MDKQTFLDNLHLAKMKKEVKSKEEKNQYKSWQKKTCNECGLTLSCYSAFYLHVRAQHEGTRYRCSLCNNTYRYKHILTHHFNSVHLGMTYKCEKCGKLFKQYRAMEKHRRKRCQKNIV